MLAKARFYDKFLVMTASELRNKYLEFFKSKGHTIISSASLVPENDPTVLFTTAGMHPLVPYLMGEKHPAGARLTNVQKCIRTSDIDEVGDATHHTFFEMMGNWSLGSYFKEEAIKMSWEFLTSPQWLNLDKGRLAVSVFAGDPSTSLDPARDKSLGASVPFDEESFNLWKGLGVAEARIAKLPKKNNWWGPAGQTGPCGPDTEMFYWAGPSTGSGQVPEKFDADDDRWVEIWNDVFMQYNKNAEGKYEKLVQRNVDTGMGLERTLAALNDLDDNYKTELFWPLIGKLEELSGKKYGQSPEITKSMRIVADHIKAATFILGDEKRITPSNVGAGYVLRRLIRRAVRSAFSLDIKESFSFEIAGEVIRIYKDTYPELDKNKEFIIHQLVKEENKFKETLEQGLKEFEKIKPKFNTSFGLTEFGISGEDLFMLYSTFGFPVELSIEEIGKIFKEKNIEIPGDVKERFSLQFHEALKKHQELSRTASAGMFKGGLADASEATVKYHTAAHLMLAALKQVLGENVSQKGSNITPERLRFDFSYGQKMTLEQIKQVEDIVNEQIKNDLAVVCEEMDLEKAKAAGATGVFGAKYGERVKVYSIGKKEGEPFSREICGGPHAERTGMLGKFKIVKEEASSAGVRRIKAILE